MPVKEEEEPHGVDLTPRVVSVHGPICLLI
jgi:hypothetical protein